MAMIALSNVPGTLASSGGGDSQSSCKAADLKIYKDDQVKVFFVSCDEAQFNRKPDVKDIKVKCGDDDGSCQTAVQDLMWSQCYYSEWEDSKYARAYAETYVDACSGDIDWGLLIGMVFGSSVASIVISAALGKFVQRRREQSASKGGESLLSTDEVEGSGAHIG